MKQKFNVITSTCVPLPLENVDTDQIIPARFLKATTREEKFFGDKAAKYRLMHLEDALMTIPYLCAVDEFQGQVFENPSCNSKERREMWHRIEERFLPWRDYADNKFLNEGGFWMQKQHIFLFPFYYIDYTLAQVCALQFYVRMLNNDENAWKDYVHICGLGGTKTFTQIVKEANLKVPFEDGCLKEVSVKMKQQLDSINDMTM